MFWGLIMEPQRRYTQIVKKAFHISMAALDLSSSAEEPAQVMCGFDGRNYLLCTLRKPDILQVPLDLSFEAGTEVSFATNGKCHIHLSGYLIEEDDYGLEGLEEEEEEENEIIVKPTKIKIANSDDSPVPKKKKKKDTSITVSSGKAAQQEDSDDSDIEDDLLGSDDNDSDELELEDEEEEDNELVEEEEQSEDDENEDDDEESELSDDEDEQPKLKENGLPKKAAKQEQKQKKVVSTPKVDKATKKEQKTLKAEENKQQQQQKTQNQKATPKKQTLSQGVVIEELREGSGAVAKGGKFVHVYYEGRLKQNNKMFDSTTKGPGFSFRLGKGEVIKGWDVGVAGMKVGGKRRITCPPHVAYGPKGSPPVIPPNSTLVFDVELKKVS